jgi:large subunit ribosomal protein L25
MERQELAASVRTTTGKGAARRLRAAGKIPAIAYGSGVSTLHLELPVRPLERALERGRSTLLALAGVRELDGRLVLVKELQRDPASRRIVHCDFYAVDVTRRVEVSVPIHLEGKAPGVVAGGVLEPMLRELVVRCLPLEIPAVIHVDVSRLEIGDSIRVGDLVLPAGCESVSDLAAGVAHVIIPRAEEEAAPAAAEEVPAEGAAAEPAEGAAEEKEGAKEREGGRERKEREKGRGE